MRVALLRPTQKSRWALLGQIHLSNRFIILFLIMNGRRVVNDNRTIDYDYMSERGAEMERKRKGRAKDSDEQKRIE